MSDDREVEVGAHEMAAARAFLRSERFLRDHGVPMSPAKLEALEDEQAAVAYLRQARGINRAMDAAVAIVSASDNGRGELWIFRAVLGDAAEAALAKFLVDVTTIDPKVAEVCNWIVGDREFRQGFVSLAP